MSNDPKTDHAYDGIEEFDNPLPGWWKWLFIASIVFSPIYWMFFHGGAEGRSIEDQYGAALAANTRLQFSEIGDLNPDADTILRFMNKDNWVKVGQVVFKTNCISCHGRDGEGKVGPDLTDDFYKNLTKIDEIASVVSNGAGNGAMPKWSNRLHVNEIVLVSAYVATLRGKNLESPRAAEGKIIAPWPEPPAELEPTEDGKSANKVESQ